MTQLLRTKLAPDAVSVTRARHAVVGGLCDQGLDRVTETAALLTSELAANAVCHARTPFIVSVDLDGQRARIEVIDESDDPPCPRAGPPDEPGGLGLAMIATMATRWGYEALQGQGKVVWFELDI